MYNQIGLILNVNTLSQHRKGNKKTTTTNKKQKQKQQKQKQQQTNWK